MHTVHTAARGGDPTNCLQDEVKLIGRRVKDKHHSWSLTEESSLSLTRPPINPTNCPQDEVKLIGRRVKYKHHSWSLTGYWLDMIWSRPVKRQESSLSLTRPPEPTPAKHVTHHNTTQHNIIQQPSYITITIIWSPEPTHTPSKRVTHHNTTQHHTSQHIIQYNTIHQSQSTHLF